MAAEREDSDEHVRHVINELEVGEHVTRRLHKQPRVAHDAHQVDDAVEELHRELHVTGCV